MVVVDQGWLGDARAVEVRSDNQKSINVHGGGDSLDFVYCSTRTLLASAHEKRKFVLACCHFLARRFNHLKIFVFIKMCSLASGAENHVTADAGAVPLSDVRTKGAKINFTGGIEWRRDRQEDAAQISRRKRGVRRLW